MHYFVDSLRMSLTHNMPVTAIVIIEAITIPLPSGVSNGVELEVGDDVVVAVVVLVVELSIVCGIC